MSLTLLAAAVLLSCSSGKFVKQPSAAGAYYPADPAELRQAVQELISEVKAEPDPPGRLLAITSPHADILYCGLVAAQGFARLKDVHTVFIIGPTHSSGYKGASVFPRGSFKTPLGLVPVDEASAARLIKPEADISFIQGAFDREYSIENQLPYLQTVLGDFRIVPIVLGRPTAVMYEHLSETLADLLQEDDGAVIVTSVDLSHYHDYDTAVRLDTAIIDALKRISSVELIEVVETGKGEVEGPEVLLLTLKVLERLGATEARLFRYLNSGDTVATTDSVVGYASMGFYLSGLSKEDKKELVTIARDVATRSIKRRSPSEYHTDNPRLGVAAGVIVKITKDGKVIGKSGLIRTSQSIHDSVIRHAGKAALAARRASVSLKPGDLGISISIITKFERVSDLNEFQVGRQGLYARYEMEEAYLMPGEIPRHGRGLSRALENLARELDVQGVGLEGLEVHTFEVQEINDADF